MKELSQEIKQAVTECILTELKDYRDNKKNDSEFLPLLDSIITSLTMIQLDTKSRNKPKVNKELTFLNHILDNIANIDVVSIGLKGEKVTHFNGIAVNLFKEMLRQYKNHKFEFQNIASGLNLKNEVEFLTYLDSISQTIERDAVIEICEALHTIFPRKKNDSIYSIAHRLLELAELRESQYSENAKRAYIRKKVASN